MKIILKYKQTLLTFLMLGTAILLLGHIISGAIKLLNMPAFHVEATSAIRAQAPIQSEALFGSSPVLLAQSSRLKLKGIFTGTVPEKGSAIIAESGAKPRLYIVGDTVPGGAKLAAVYNTEVILEEAGKQSRLLLPQHVF